MPRPLLLVAALLSLLPTATFAQNTALDAVQLLPASYRTGVLKISADNGNPNPPQWYFIARGGYGDGKLHSVTIQDGDIISDKPSLDLRTLIGDPSPIDFDRVKINSTDAWSAALKYASDKGRKLGSVSYALQQKGSKASPIWSVWCYDKAGSYIGLITLLATSGDILSSE